MITIPPPDIITRSRASGRWRIILASLAFSGGMLGCTTVRKPQPVDASTLELAPSTPAELQGVPFSRALAHFSLALGHEFRDEKEEALEAYRQAIENDPDNDNLYLITSQRLLQNDRDADAFRLLDTLLERDPDNARLLRWRAHLHLKSGENDQALQLLQRAVALHPPQEATYLLAVQLELRKNRMDEALAVGRIGLAHAEDPLKLTRWMVELLLTAAGQSQDLQSSVALRDEAENLLATAIDDYPDEIQFLLKKAELLVEAGEKEDAWPYYRRADGRAEDPSEFRAMILMHMIRASGGMQEGLASVQNFLEEDKEGDFLKYYLLGQIREARRSASEALELYQKAAELMPEDWATQRKLALLYYRNDQPFRAASLLEKVLEPNPDDPEIRLLAAQLQWAADNFTRALPHYEKLDVLIRQGEDVGDQGQIAAQFAMVLLALGHEDRAVDAMLTAMEADPSHLENIWAHQIRLSLLSDEAGREEEAEEQQRLMLEALLDLSDLLPDHPLVEIQIGITHTFRQEYSRGIEAFIRANGLAQDSGNPSQWMTSEVKFEWAAALERKGRIEEAVQKFEEVISEDPDHHRALNYVAYMWAERGRNLDKALDYVKRALRRDPENGSYLDTLGWVYYQQGEFEKARVELEKAAEQDPMQPVIVEHLGDAMLKLGRAVEAAGYYRITLHLGAEEREDAVRASLKKAEDLAAELATR